VRGPKKDAFEREGHVFTYDEKYPTDLIEFNNRAGAGRGMHPTQKPVALFEYLISTYTQAGDLVLDNAAGAMTTGVAAERLGRKWICIEKEKRYFDLGRGRFVPVEDV
jgi:DNA modification methylase